MKAECQQIYSIRDTCVSGWLRRTAGGTILASIRGMAIPFRPSAARLAHPAKRWLEVLARWGFVANAVVYLIVGTLALKWGLGAGGRLTDPDGAFRALEQEPFGKPLLIILIPGFFSYALWRFLAAFYDGDRDGSSPVGMFSRAFGVLKGVLYAGLGLSAWRLALGSGDDRSGWVSEVLHGSAGRPLMFAAAAALLAFAAFEFYRAMHSRLSQGLHLALTNGEARRWIVRISRFGIGARALVIAAFAFLLFRYAEAGRSSLPAAQQSFHVLGQVHPALYIVAGSGIVAYGIYLIVLANYRRVDTGA